MRVLFDTSILVAAIVEAHSRHEPAVSWLRRARAGEFEFLAAAHSLAELYSTLSTLPARPRISPAVAWRLVQENVATQAHLIALSPEDYRATIERAVEAALSGGVIYDALIARAAEIGGADRLLTLNAADFRRISPEIAAIVVTP